MTQRFGKQLKYLGSGLDIWGTTSVFEVRHKHVAKDSNILNMPSMCGKRIKYLRNGFTMLKMIEQFDKRLICKGNDVCMWEIA